MFRLVTLWVLSMAGAATAQSTSAPDLSGTWVIQTDIDAARNRRPINGVSIATEMVIRQSPSEVAIETNTGTAGTIVTTTHKLDGSEYEVPGPIGWGSRATSAWDGSTLAVELHRSVQGPAGELVFDIRERYTRTDDRLTLVRTLGRTTQTLVYELQ